MERTLGLGVNRTGNGTSSTLNCLEFQGQHLLSEYWLPYHMTGLRRAEVPKHSHPSYSLVGLTTYIYPNFLTQKLQGLTKNV